MIYRVKFHDRIIEIEESTLQEFHSIYKEKAVLWEVPIDVISWEGSGIWCPFFIQFEPCYKEFLFKKYGRKIEGLLEL